MIPDNAFHIVVHMAPPPLREGPELSDLIVRWLDRIDISKVEREALNSPDYSGETAGVAIVKRLKAIARGV